MLTLSLHAPRREFVRGESIEVDVTLRNGDGENMEVEDISPFSSSLWFRATHSSGTIKEGSPMSLFLNEGFEVGPIRRYITLEPGGTLSASADLITIVGELEEGEHILSASYFSGLDLSAESDEIPVRVLKPRCGYSKTILDYHRIIHTPFRTVWLNQEQGANTLFMMERSQRFPTNLKSNQRILELDRPYKVLPSTLESYGQAAEHLLWQKDQTVNIAVLEEHKLRDPIHTLKLPLPQTQLLEPALTDERGNLHILTVGIGDDGLQSFRLVHVPRGNELKVSRLGPSFGKLGPYSLMFDMERTLHLAWAPTTGKELYYGICHFSEAANEQMSVKKLAVSDSPISILQWCEWHNSEEGGYLTGICYLTIDRKKDMDEFRAHIMDSRTGRNIRYSSFAFSSELGLRPVQIAVDFDGKPHFLLTDTIGKVWFKSFRRPDLTPLTSARGQRIRTSDFPTILVASDFSPDRAIYLQYVEDASYLACKRLESF